MVIDYSKWNNLQVSSSEDEDDAPTLQSYTAATSASVATRNTAEATVASTIAPPTPSGSNSRLSEQELARLPKLVLLVRSTNRDRILQQMIRNNLSYARPIGPYGISLVCSFHLPAIQMVQFFPGFGTSQVAKIQASLLYMTTDHYEATLANRPDFRGGMAGVPYDAKF